MAQFIESEWPDETGQLSLFHRHVVELEEEDAPWTPVPLAQAQAFLKENPEAQVDFVFPTAHEEDRSSKLKDLAVAQGLDWISHQRTAETAAQEFGFERFNYKNEMEQIRKEKQTEGDILGSGDALANKIASTTTGIDPNAATTDPTVNGAGQQPGVVQSTMVDRTGGPTPEFSDKAPKRGALSGTSKAQFRQDQREGEETDTDDD